jgi:hypothetical protein
VASTLHASSTQHSWPSPGSALALESTTTRLPVSGAHIPSPVPKGSEGNDALPTASSHDVCLLPAATTSCCQQPITPLTPRRDLPHPNVLASATPARSESEESALPSNRVPLRHFQTNMPITRMRFGRCDSGCATVAWTDTAVGAAQGLSQTTGDCRWRSRRVFGALAKTRSTGDASGWAPDHRQGPGTGTFNTSSKTPWQRGDTAPQTPGPGSVPLDAHVLIPKPRRRLQPPAMSRASQGRCVM